MRQPIDSTGLQLSSWFAQRPVPALHNFQANVGKTERARSALTAFIEPMRRTVAPDSSGNMHHVVIDSLAHAAVLSLKRPRDLSNFQERRGAALPNGSLDSTLSVAPE
jgi:hypothetical protein